MRSRNILAAIMSARPAATVNPFVTTVNPGGLGVKRQNTAFAATDSANTSGTYEWSYLLNEVEEANYTTRAINATLTELGMHDLLLTVSRTNALDRYIARAVSVLPAPFTEGEADVVFDLDAVQAGTFSNPLGDASIAGNGTNNFAYDFDDVVRAGLKIYVKGTYSGRMNIIGLRGTEASPVRIQCDTAARATINATNGSQPYALQFTTGNQYIHLDGSACLVDDHGFLLQGYIAGATSGQILFCTGSNQKGFHFNGIECNGRKNDPESLNTNFGGAAIQFQPPTPSSGQHAGNYSQEYIKIHNCYIHDNFGEGIYVGYFSDAEQSGFRPDRMGDVYIYDNIITHCHRDGIQVASSDYCEIFRNTISYTSEEESDQHLSAISWNDGNLTSYIYNNWVEECDMFISGQNGSTGTGDYYIFCNFARQRDTILAGTGNQFVYLAVDNANCDYHFFNNTIICPDVVEAPVTIQHNNVGSFQCLNFTFAGNVISTSGNDQATWPELRRVNTPGDTSGWYIDNVWRRTADEAQLQLDSSYKPNARTSPAYGAGFDWSVRFVGVDFFGGQRDLEGFVLKTGNSPTSGLGFTAGAYANHPIWIPDADAPTIDSAATSNVASTQFDIDITTNEQAIHYYVVVADGDPVPSKSQIIAGQNSSGAAALDSGSAIGKTTSQTVTGRTADTAYDVHSVAVDGSGNQSDIESLDVTTSVSTQQVVLAEVGAISGTVGVTQRASTGTLTPPLPVDNPDFEAGDLIICMASIRATGGVADITEAGWSQIDTHRMGTTSNGEFYLFGKIADGTESGSVTVTFPNDFGVTKMARCFRFKHNNAASVAAAIESIAKGQGTSNTYAAQNVTSTVNLALAVQFVAVADDNVTGSFTGESGADYTEDATYVYTGGTGGAHSVQTAEKATAGAITGGTFVMAASDPWGVIGLVIKP